jgi:hypothetical protein
MKTRPKTSPNPNGSALGPLPAPPLWKILVTAAMQVRMNESAAPITTPSKSTSEPQYGASRRPVMRIASTSRSDFSVTSETVDACSTITKAKGARKTSIAPLESPCANVA